MGPDQPGRPGSRPGPGDPSPVDPSPVDPSGRTAARARQARRGLIGPFTGRQLLVVVAVVAGAAVTLSLATTPLAPGPAGPTPLPGTTPYLVGPATEGLRPGDLAPELEALRDDGTRFVLTDLDGRPVRLADLRGRLVWLNFWASWCPPCQAETPVLRAMDEAYRERGLSLIGVAVQETTIDDVRAYAERYELGYPIAFDVSADIFRRYRVFALPTQFLIAADGRILSVVNGPVDEAGARSRIEGWLPSR